LESGIWKAKQIDNTDFFRDDQPAAFDYVDAIALELWTVEDGVMFDNILVCDSEQTAKEFALTTWGVKHEKERAEQIEEAKVKFAQDEINSAKKKSRSFGEPSQINAKKSTREFANDLLDDLVWFGRRFQKSPISAIKHNPLLAFNLAFIVVLIITLLMRIVSLTDKVYKKKQPIKKSDEAVQAAQVIESSAPLNVPTPIEEELSDSTSEMITEPAPKEEKPKHDESKSVRKRK
jgi:calnexin